MLRLAAPRSRRIRGDGKRRDRHLRLARRVEPAHLVRGPQIDAAERQGAAESEQGTLRLALDRKQQSGIAPFRIFRAAMFRKGEELTYDYSTDGEGSISCRCRPGCKVMI